jgi:hypothetical protein
VRKYFREVQTCPDDATALFEEVSPHIDDSDEAILSELEELPFSSGRQLSRATRRPKTTVHRQLSEKLGLIKHHLG